MAAVFADQYGVSDVLALTDLAHGHGPVRGLDRNHAQRSHARMRAPSPASALSRMRLAGR